MLKYKKASRLTNEALKTVVEIVKEARAARHNCRADWFALLTVDYRLEVTKREMWPQYYK